MCRRGTGVYTQHHYSYYTLLYVIRYTQCVLLCVSVNDSVVLYSRFFVSGTGTATGSTGNCAQQPKRSTTRNDEPSCAEDEPWRIASHGVFWLLRRHSCIMLCHTLQEHTPNHLFTTYLSISMPPHPPPAASTSQRRARHPSSGATPRLLPRVCSPCKPHGHTTCSCPLHPSLRRHPAHLPHTRCAHRSSK